MGTAIELTVAILLPTAVGYALIGTVRGRRWIADRHSRLPEEPVERLGADLCRLHAQLDATENAVGLFAKNLRRNAVRAAYVDALTAACQSNARLPPNPTSTSTAQTSSSP